MAIRLRTLACAAIFVLPACAIRLTDRNSPLENGGVTGPPADCSKVTPEPGGSYAGEAAPKFVGRFAVVQSDDPDSPVHHVFDWSGNYITVRFQGTDRITIKLAITGEIPQDQMFEFVVDDLPPDNRRITVKENAAGVPTNIPLENYDIINLDPKVPHEVTIYKNTEAQKGQVIFKGFDLHGGTFLPPTRRPRRIEFIGDSITCGYGNEGKNATCPFEVKIRDARDANGNIVMKNGKPAAVTVPVTERQYLSFTALAARELDADAVTICWSGKGVYKNFKERVVRLPDGSVGPEPDSQTTVPELWRARTLATDNQNGTPWNFTSEPEEEKPDVVVVTLGTNDFARDTEPPSNDPDKLAGDNVPDGDLGDPAELERFYEKYLAFVKEIRQHRPKAHIFLANSPMLTDQFPLDNARSTLRDVLRRIAAEMDDKVYAMDLVEQGFRYGLGCDYHPNLTVHAIMAKQLVGAIRSKTCWTSR
jgi:lysophospholipase L1-like esterase